MCLIKITKRRPKRKGYGIKRMLLSSPSRELYSAVYFSYPHHLGHWSVTDTNKFTRVYKEFDEAQPRYKPHFHVWLERPPANEGRSPDYSRFVVVEYDGATVEGLEYGYVPAGPNRRPLIPPEITVWDHVPAVVAKRIKPVFIGTEEEAIAELNRLRTEGEKP